MNKNLKLIAYYSFALLILVSLVGLDFYVHNFNTVIPMKIYRSRQLSQAQFEKVIDQYHIKSILNLRGTHPKNEWYRQETAAAKKMSVNHYDLPLNSKVFPSPEQLKQLVQIIATSPKPLLIHCESGVDRTGLGSVISLILANRPLKEIEKQVSLRYFVFSPQSVGKQLLRKYEGWLEQKNMQTNRENFYQWIHFYISRT